MALALKAIILLQLLDHAMSESGFAFFGYEFTDRSSNSNTNNFLLIEPVKALKYEKGLTVCTRMQIEFWNMNYIFNSTDAGLLFSQYNKYEGMVRFEEVFYNFRLPKNLKLASWNSVCFSLNRTASRIQFSMNDYITNVSINQESNSAVQVLMVEPALLVGNFTGKVTDVNVWDEPFTQDQLLEFGNGCFNNFSLTKRFPPNVIEWPARRIIAVGSTVRNYSIQDTELCKFSYLLFKVWKTILR